MKGKGVLLKGAGVDCQTLGLTPGTFYGRDSNSRSLHISSWTTLFERISNFNAILLLFPSHLVCCALLRSLHLLLLQEPLAPGATARRALTEGGPWSPVDGVHLHVPKDLRWGAATEDGAGTRTVCVNNAERNALHGRAVPTRKSQIPFNVYTLGKC